MDLRAPTGVAIVGLGLFVTGVAAYFMSGAEDGGVCEDEIVPECATTTERRWSRGPRRGAPKQKPFRKFKAEYQSKKMRPSFWDRIYKEDFERRTRLGLIPSRQNRIPGYP